VRNRYNVGDIAIDENFSMFLII